jgi:hypothetical protein
MPNQMIALQARNPQIADPSAQTAKYVNMMNMAKQQEAAQRQAALAQQTMDINLAQEARAAETQTSAQKEAGLKYLKDLTAQYRDRLATINPADKARYGVLRQEIITNIPAFDNELPLPDEWNQESKVLTISKADDVIKYSLATPVASLELSQQGMPRSVVVGGLPGAAEQRPVYDAPNAAPTAAPAATPTTAPEANPFAADAAPANTAAENVNSLGLVIASARETGVMAQRDVDKLLSAAAPGSAPKLMAWLSQNNIQVAPDAPGVTDNQLRGAAADLPNEMRTTPMAYDGQTPQSQFAVYRGEPVQSQTAGLRGAPPMEQTLAQNRTSTPLMQKTPNVSPAPAETPEQAGKRALLTRETAGEVYAKEKARAQAQREALLEAGPKPLTAPQEAKLRANITKDYKSARSTIDMMLNPVAGVVAAVNNVRKLSPDQKEAITGYSGYLPTMYASTKSADTAIKNLKGKVTEMGKSVASLTGAIGQMAVQEWRIVSDMIANLDLEGMGAADLDNQLDIIEAQARRAVEVTRDAYENQYVEEFARYPGRFRLPDAAAAAAPDAKRRTPTKGAVDRNNPLLRKQ